MSRDNPNQCGYYEQETIPCDLCGTPTPMTGTRRCDPCWELERRVEQRPEVARKLVAAMTAIDPDATTQLITRLTEALEAIAPRCDFIVDRDKNIRCGAIAIAEGSFGLKYCRDHKGDRDTVDTGVMVESALAAVAKERAE